MSEEALHRSGVVARLVGMPVATLRVWERRYGLGCAATAGNGRRLYSHEDVQRIALLKRLTESGHGIGTVAHLDLARLSALTRLPEALPAVRDAAPAAARVVVVGEPLALALRPLLGPSTGLTLSASVDRLGGAEPGGLPACELLLCGCSTLHGLAAGPLWALGRALGARQVGVVYGYGAARDRSRLALAGLELLREPRDPGLMLGWLQQLARRPAAPAPDGRAGDDEGLADRGWMAPPPARRYDEAVLGRLAAQPSGVACECPRHVAEILLQLSQFEDYTQGCASRHADDAALHRDLGRAAAAARAIFEMALEQVARHEGLALDAADTPPKP